MSKSQKNGAEISLAGFLTSLKSNEHSSQKLNVVGKGITKIGNAIPPQYRDVKVLYLSRNNLKALDDVQQFTSLRAFSAADNLLPSFSSVAPLQTLTALEAVSLEGNPLTDLPNYRYRMILMLEDASLNQLDGKSVTLEEKKLAATVCAVEDAILNLAVNTTCLINSFTRAQHMSKIHSEMYSKLWQREINPGGGKNHLNSISRLVFLFEQRRLSLELTAEFEIEKEEIKESLIAQSITWHEKALKKGGGGAGKSSAALVLSWHAAFCRILADQAAKLEELVLRSTTTTTGSTKDTIATVFVSIRQALQQLGKLRPGIDTDAAEQAERLGKRVIELHFKLVQELNSREHVEGGDEDADFSSWLIPAAAAGTAGATDSPPGMNRRDLSPLRPPTLSKSLATKSTNLNSQNVDMTTLAAQHIVATESVAKLEACLKETERQAEVLSEEVSQTRRKSEAIKAENQLLRQEQAASKEANAALQKWLETANREVEQANKQIEMLRTDLGQAHEMHAVEIAQLQSQIETLQCQIEDLQSQIEETDAMMRSDAQDHENLIFKLEGQLQAQQHHTRRLEEELETAIHAAETAARVPQPIKLEINVFLARELELEKAKNSELALQVLKQREEAAAVAAELEAVLELQKQQAAASEELQRATLARKAELERLEEYGLTLQARRVAGCGLAAWRLAAQRSKKLTTLELQKTQKIRSRVFYTWNNYTKSASLLRTLNEAAVTTAKISFMSKMFAMWRSTSNRLKQELLAELPGNDPRVHLAMETFRKRYLKSLFQAWRDRTQAAITNNEALIVFSVAQREAEKLKEAFAVWREAAAIHREESLEISCGFTARRVVFSRQVLRAWRLATSKAVALAIAEAAVTRASKRALLTKVLAVWVDCRVKSAEEAAILQEEEECQALEAQQRENALIIARKKAEIRAHSAFVALQRQIFSTWRTEVAYSKHIDAISAWCESSRRRQLLLRSLGSWRAAVYSDQVEELAHQLGQVEASLRVASSEISFKEQEIEDLTALRLEALSRVADLEDDVAAFQEQLATAAQEASLLEERLQQAEAAKTAAEENKKQAVLGAEAAVAVEQQARQVAQDACQQAQEEREKAISSARASQSEAAAAQEACRIAEQRAQAAEKARAEAEIVAIEALESVEAAASACERLAEECAGLHSALNEANQRYTTLQERYSVATDTIYTSKAAEERYQAEHAGLEQQLQTVQQRWKDAEEAKEIAESDAHVAIRQAQRLAEMLEQHVQHQEHPLALIYK